jgi:hypothetical protein
MALLAIGRRDARAKTRARRRTKQKENKARVEGIAARRE